MGNPALVSCPAGQWTRVAHNIASGLLHIKNSRPGVYLQTYRTVGSPAPESADEGVALGGTSVTIGGGTGVDVYVMAVGTDGLVRVDLYAAPGGGLVVAGTSSASSAGAITLAQSGGTFIMAGATSASSADNITLSEGV